MPNTMSLIDSYTVGAGGIATITLSSIPQTYTDLLVKISARGASAGAARNILISFNGSSANFTMKNLVNEGGTVASYTQGAYGGQNATGYSTAATTTASTFSNGDFYFANYTSSNNKSVGVENVSENNLPAGWAWVGSTLWSSSAAITSLSFSLDSGNYAQYSTVYLYGIKNS